MGGSCGKDISVFLVDDHAVVRVGLRTVLGGSPGITIAGEAATAAEAVRDIPRLKPDVVLMDIRLPDLSGVEACSRIHAACPDTRVLFLTSFADEEAVMAAVSGGADGYLLKEANVEGLVQAIRSVHRGQPVLDPAVTQPILMRMRSISTDAAEPSKAKLSSQQQKVLQLVAEGKTNKEIGASLHLSDKTVKNYVRYIFQKLRVTRRSQAAAHFVRYTSQQGQQSAARR
jgi:DNA-binding NarL/FixJ family response regulator